VLDATLDFARLELAESHGRSFQVCGSFFFPYRPAGVFSGNQPAEGTSQQKRVAEQGDLGL
jgi:hypothetical protein